MGCFLELLSLFHLTHQLQPVPFIKIKRCSTEKEKNCILAMNMLLLIMMYFQLLVSLLQHFTCELMQRNDPLGDTHTCTSHTPVNLKLLC